MWGEGGEDEMYSEGGESELSEIDFNPQGNDAQTEDKKFVRVNNNSVPELKLPREPQKGEV